MLIATACKLPDAQSASRRVALSAWLGRSSVGDVDKMTCCNTAAGHPFVFCGDDAVALAGFRFENTTVGNLDCASGLDHGARTFQIRECRGNARASTPKIIDS